MSGRARAEVKEGTKEAGVSRKQSMNRARVTKASATSPCLQILVSAAVGHTPEAFISLQGDVCWKHDHGTARSPAMGRSHVYPPPQTSPRAAAAQGTADTPEFGSIQSPHVSLLAQRRERESRICSVLLGMAMGMLFSENILQGGKVQ